MSDLRSVLRDAVPSTRPPELGGLWEQGTRERRRRRMLAGAAPAVLVAAAVLGVIVGARGEPGGMATTASTTIVGENGSADATSVVDAPSLRSLSVSGGLRVRVVPGSGRVTIDGDRTVLSDDIVVDSHGPALSITRTSPRDRQDEPVTVTVEIGAVDELSATNGVEISIDLTQSDPIRLDAATGVTVSGTLHAPRLTLTARTGATVELDGAVTTAEFSGSTGVALNLGDLRVERLRADLADGTSAEVWVTDVIEHASVQGGSTLRYRGNPTVDDADVDVSSTLEERAP